MPAKMLLPGLEALGSPDVRISDIWLAIIIVIVKLGGRISSCTQPDTLRTAREGPRYHRNSQRHPRMPASKDALRRPAGQ